MNKYLYLNGQRLSKVTSDIKEAKVQNNIGSYYYNDAQGSPLAEINEQGQTLWREAYLPFGAKLLNGIDITVNKFGFVGKEMDESGLSYFGARYYNPISGRFMAPDPVEVKPEIPATFNRYAYGYNNPYKYVDPDGRWAYVLAIALGAGSGFIHEWYDGNRNTSDLFKGATMGAVVGAIPGLKGASLGAKILLGASGSVLGDTALKLWKHQSDQITMLSTLDSAFWGGFGATFGHVISYLNVPFQNFPSTRGYINPTTRTIRELPRNHSEFYDAPKRSMSETISGVTLGLATEQVVKSGLDRKEKVNK